MSAETDPPRTPALIPGRALIALSGEERADWLQGLITQDVTKLAPGRGLYGALLTPQGKIITDFFLSEEGGRMLIDAPEARAGDLLKRLTLYKLRAKITLEPLGGAWGVGESAGPGGPLSYPDPRDGRMGWRTPAPVEMLGPAAGDYETRQRALALPGPDDVGTGELFALEAGLDRLNGVDFKKGCYVGQELTARMKHRTTVKKKIVPVELAGSWPGPGTPVMAGEIAIGKLLTGEGQAGLAFLNLERAEGQALTAGPFGVRLVG